MKNLLYTEWLKLRRYRTFWIILSSFAFLAPFTYYIFYQVMVASTPLEGMVTNVSSFSSIWYNLCYVFSQLIIFPALLMVMLCTNEFQFKTHRQNVIDGWQREAFFNAKWLLALYLSLGIIVFALIVGVFIGIVRGASFAYITDGIEYVGMLFILTLNYLGLGILTGLLLRRTGLAVILLLAYYLIVDNLLHTLFKYKLDMLFLDLFLPMEASDQMMPWPRFNNVMGVDAMMKFKQLPLWSYALASLTWIGIYYSIIKSRLLRTDW